MMRVTRILNTRTRKLLLFEKIFCPHHEYNNNDTYLYSAFLWSNSKKREDLSVYTYAYRLHSRSIHQTTMVYWLETGQVTIPVEPVPMIGPTRPIFLNSTWKQIVQWSLDNVGSSLQYWPQVSLFIIRHQEQIVHHQNQNTFQNLVYTVFWHNLTVHIVSTRHFFKFLLQL